MQPTRSLDDIIASLNSVYQPQIGLIQQQQAALPQQAQTQTDALSAKKDQAFGDIVNGARQRGLGFSGIPLGDQAKYLSTDYLPAIANLQTASNQQATSLQQAILQLQQQQNTQGQSIYQSEQDRAASLEAAREAAAAQNSAYSGLFGGQTPSPTTPTSAAVDPLKQQATSALFSLFGTNNQSLIQNTVNAIKKSASYGNTYDQLKLQLIQSLHPEYLTPQKAAAPAKATAPAAPAVKVNTSIFKGSTAPLGIK